MSDLGALERVLSHTKRRVRVQRAWQSSAYAVLVGCSLVAVAHPLCRLFGQPASPLLELGLVAALALLAALVRALFPVANQGAAASLDRAHGLHDRVQAAVEFASCAPEQRTPFMQAALRDAVARAQALSPVSAVPLRTPEVLKWTWMPLALWGLGLAWPAATPVAERVIPVSQARVLDAEEVDAFRDELRVLTQNAALTKAANEEVRSYNSLLERLATAELSRAEALKALLSLERKLLEETPSSERENVAALRELANDLAKASESTAKALAELDADKAAKELAALAKALAEGKLSAAEKERLAQALAKERAREKSRDAARAKEKELDSLLRQRGEKPPTDPGEKSLFERQKRELERLRRDREAHAQKHRELSRLSRDVSDAAEALDRDAPDEASSAVQKGAEDLRRYAEDQLSAEQKKELARQVAQLREMLQRKGQGQAQNGQGGQKQGQQQQGQGQGQGQDRDSRTQRFVLRAQGKNPDKDGAKLVMRMPGQQGQGQQGQGQQGQGQQGQQGQGQQGQQGQGGKSGQGQGAEGQGPSGQSGAPGQAGGPQVLELGGDGPATAEIELPGMGGQRTVTSKGAGDEHDPRTLRSPTNIDAAHQDSHVAGTPSAGPTRSQVILDAADRGFATSSYRKVYTDYRTHAEDVLEQDRIPPGYRFYVRRYFQLIRPRDEGNE